MLNNFTKIVVPINHNVFFILLYKSYYSHRSERFWSSLSNVWSLFQHYW